eukprot:g14839.t1
MDLSTATAEVALVNRILWASAALSFGLQTLGFVHGYVFQTEKLFDVLGGLNFLFMIPLGYLLATYTSDAPEGASTEIISEPRKWVLAGCFGLSRVYLLAFLGYRACARDGDSRFDELKTSFLKYFFVWFYQALWVWIVSLPLLVVLGNRLVLPFAWHDYLCGVCFLLALGLQIASDVVKNLWVRRGRAGGFCTVGPWAVSRHPNYFGEITMWFLAWGFTIPLIRAHMRNADEQMWSTALLRSSESSTSSHFLYYGFLYYSLIALLSPLWTMFLLLFLSGLPLAEGKNLARYYRNNPDTYPEYRRKTFILCPIPGLAGVVPMWFKRVFCCEWPMYEYEEEEFAKLGEGRGESGSSGRQQV